MFHGEEEARKAEASARSLFSGAGDSADMPSTVIGEDALTDGAVDILTALVLTGLCASKSDARRNVQQGGITVDDQKVSDIAKSFSADQLKNGIVIRKGKKSYNKLIIK